MLLLGYPKVCGTVSKECIIERDCKTFERGREKENKWYYHEARMLQVGGRHETAYGAIIVFDKMCVCRF